MADWNRLAAAHLIRRTGMGARKREVDAALADGSQTAAAARLVLEAKAAPRPPAPAGSSGTDVEGVYAIQRHWYEQMLTGNGLREKMTLWLHNLLVVQYMDAGMAPATWPYLDLLRKRALGNYKTLVEEIGLEPAMLLYLNGDGSRGDRPTEPPNENYARELMELFTMGQTAPDGSLNYTEADVKAAARALSGWQVATRNGAPRATFDSRRHDGGSKTFLGQTGTWGYDDIVRILFEQRAPQIAQFVATKLYAFFVQAIPDREFVDRLAQTFRSGGWELAPVVEELLASDHFYQAGLRAARVKSPVELVIGMLREAEIPTPQSRLESVRVSLKPPRLGHELLNPPNVAGWPGLNPPASDGAPGHHTWLTTSTLPSRWNLARDLINARDFDPFELARKVSDPSNPFALPTDLARLLLPVPLGESSIRDVPTEFGGDPNRPPPQAFLDGPAYAIDLTKILLDGAPWYDWPDFSVDTPDNVAAARLQLRTFLAYLVELPEYQLT